MPNFSDLYVLPELSKKIKVPVVDSFATYVAKAYDCSIRNQCVDMAFRQVMRNALGMTLATFDHLNHGINVS
jgi:hypothetical protein